MKGYCYIVKVTKFEFPTAYDLNTAERRQLVRQTVGIPNCAPLVHVPNFEGVSGSEDRGGGDSSIQFTNFGRVGDKSFKEWRQKIEGWKGG